MFTTFVFSFLVQQSMAANCIQQKVDITDKSQEVHGSTVVELKGGHLMAAWFSGGEGKAKATIQGSTWDGKTWSVPEVIETGLESGVDYPVWNPVLFHNDQDELELNYKVGPAPNSWWGRAKISKDEGKNWGPVLPISLDPMAFGPIRAKPIKLRNGLWMAGSSSETPIEPFYAKDIWQIHLEFRPANSLNWQRSTVFYQDSENMGLIQPIVFEFPNGKMQVLARSNRKKIFESWSEDSGQTWSRLAPTNLKNPNSGFDGLIRKPSGEALLVYNDSDVGRGILKVARSKDGIDWENICTLENNLFFLEYSYPAMIQTSDGKIHITYTDNRRSIKHVILAQLN
jgi:alpha-L-fucosidase